MTTSQLEDLKADIMATKPMNKGHETLLNFIFEQISEPIASEPVEQDEIITDYYDYYGVKPENFY